MNERLYELMDENDTNEITIKYTRNITVRYTYGDIIPRFSKQMIEIYTYYCNNTFPKLIGYT